MATPLRPTLRTAVLRPALVRPGRLVAVAVAVIGVLMFTVPAQAAPGSQVGSSQDVAELLAARAKELEGLTEQVNQAEDQLTASLAAVETARAALAEAQGSQAEAREEIRGIARSAFTARGTSMLSALMTSDSTDEFVSRATTLQAIAGYQGEVLGRATVAGNAAAQAQAVAAQGAAEAQALVDRLAAQQADLRAQAARYQAQFDALSAAERRQVAERADAPAASRSERPTPMTPGTVAGGGSQAAQIAVATAMAQRGKPYAWGAAGPNAFDCSGLLVYAYRAAGVALPRSSSVQATAGQAVARADLLPGDLVYFYTPVSHIGMYIGNNQMVHSSTFGQPVDVESIDALGSDAYRGARRVA